MFVRVELVNQHFTFDENIGAGTYIPAGEETDFVLRAIVADFKVLYSPELLVYHRIHHSADLRFATDREVARGYVMAKNSQDIRVAVRMLGGVGKLVIAIGRSPSEWSRLVARIRGIFLAVRNATTHRPI
jgi:GT2 family glycosyltransferase